MEIKTSKELESTGYRCLFECVKQEGLEPVLGLIKDINNISEKEKLTRQTVFSKNNDLDRIRKKHYEILKYFKTHKNELKRLSFTNNDLLNILNTLNRLSINISNVDLYLENARKLEELKVSRIEFTDFLGHDSRSCGIYRNAQEEIICINKYYTDGQIVTDGQEVLVDSMYNYSEIPFSINTDEKVSFILNVQNNEHFFSYRGISIYNFEFDSTKLPTEEMLQSYEIPEELIKKRVI